MRTPVKYVAGGAALAALGYAAFSGAKWARYGHASRAVLDLCRQYRGPILRLWHPRLLATLEQAEAAPTRLRQSA